MAGGTVTGVPSPLILLPTSSGTTSLDELVGGLALQAYGDTDGATLSANNAARSGEQRCGNDS